MEKSFEGLKARVGAKRDEQVQLSIRKAEAAIEYAVRLSTYFLGALSRRTDGNRMLLRNFTN